MVIYLGIGYLGISVNMFASLNEEGCCTLILEVKQQCFFVSNRDNTTILPGKWWVPNLDDVVLVAHDLGSIRVFHGFSKAHLHLSEKVIIGLGLDSLILVGKMGNSWASKSKRAVELIGC
jgi:hypothetical protein